jgi:plasmid stabilization system protein ParE
MERKIIWSPRAISDLENILTYLETDWSLRISEIFYAEAFHRVASICTYPDIGIQSLTIPSWRKILITKHNILVYRIDNHVIVLLNILDTRSSTYSI